MRYYGGKFYSIGRSDRRHLKYLGKIGSASQGRLARVPARRAIIGFKVSGFAVARNPEERASMKVVGDTLRALIWSALIPAYGAAQLNEAASACRSPEVVLQRYVDAVGGKAVYDIQSRVMTARESEGDRTTEHYVYKFKWKAPNK